MKNDYLQHHGILGMKWGVRRTPEQLGRARSSFKKRDDEEKRDRKTAMKKRRVLSTEELRKKIERLKLEREFKNLTEEDISPGRRFVSEVLSSSGKKVISLALAGTMAYALKAAMMKDFDIKEAAAYIAANPNKKK